MKFTIKGWAAVPVLAVLLIVAGFRMVSAESALDGEQGERLKSHLQGEYSSLLLADADGTNLDAASIDALLEVDEIEFTDVSVKVRSDEAVVRVTIEVAGDSPPDGRDVRYFRMEHQTLGGWRVVREVGKWSYYLAL